VSCFVKAKHYLPLMGKAQIANLRQRVRPASIWGVLLTCGAPCLFFTLPVPLLGFLVKQDDKKVNRIQKKSNRAAKNLTGEQKILLDGKKAYRRTKK
jgi:hypothetical protein